MGRVNHIGYVSISSVIQLVYDGIYKEWKVFFEVTIFFPQSLGLLTIVAVNKRRIFFAHVPISGIQWLYIYIYYTIGGKMHTMTKVWMVAISRQSGFRVLCVIY